ncbi:complex III assembly factor LYRM7 [Anthonomus grandis grandis]|uniref:complex III assembly factor LYRM7 n=1 Tax=Anthonomus grandis grandis TaxID=2921223 RepID=UPI002165BEAE|nr:complex III assembly factor LYRM7 [Anthonomus grandis grandis]
MSSELRKQVLQCFKSLHQARKSVFKGDIRALTEGRKKINEEFKKQKHVENTDSIKELINYSKAIEEELRSCVIQAREVAPGRFQAEISEDIKKLDNVPFNEACCRDDGPSVKKPNRKCS